MKSIEESIASYHRQIQTEQDPQGNWRVTAIFCFPPTFCGFAGHFPDVPILPAIAQLASIRYLAEVTLKKHLLPITISRTKFKSMISPDQDIHISLDLSMEDQQYHAKFQIRTPTDEMISSGSCIFSENCR
jgi:3-hydroxymyristoyl/3-hydroxydecanoyl-(acyl carrier protein) dehydratase